MFGGDTADHDGYRRGRRADRSRRPQTRGASATPACVDAVLARAAAMVEEHVDRVKTDAGDVHADRGRRRRVPGAARRLQGVRERRAGRTWRLRQRRRRGDRAGERRGRSGLPGPDAQRGALAQAARKLADTTRRGGGRGAGSSDLVEAEDTPIAYLPGNAMRVSVKVVGDIIENLQRANRKESIAMPVRFLISTLKPGVDPADYERWVRERDYALVRSKPNYLSYTVHRIRPPIDGAPEAGWQYIERIEVRSLEQHDQRPGVAGRGGAARGTLRAVPGPLEEHLFRRRMRSNDGWPVMAGGCVRPRLPRRGGRRPATHDFTVRRREKSWMAGLRPP